MCALTVENVTSSAFASLNGVSFRTTFRVDAFLLGEVAELPQATVATSATVTNEIDVRMSFPSRRFKCMGRADYSRLSQFAAEFGFLAHALIIWLKLDVSSTRPDACRYAAIALAPAGTARSRSAPPRLTTTTPDDPSVGP
jgi:hypothetical protein